MAKFRLLMLATTFVVIGVVGTITILYARGYKLNVKENNITLAPSGLLVANSDPNGAAVLINGEVKTATNNSISLAPGEYDISLRKEGFLPWNKRLTIEKEIVTQIDAFLIQSAPNLTALTFSGATNPQLSPDSSKIAYAIASDGSDSEKAGLWVLEIVNLPLGFNRDPRRITDGDMTATTWEWSPDAREILLTTKNGVFLLNAFEFTAQGSRVNVATRLEAIKAEWQQKMDKKEQSQIGKIADEFQDIFSRKAVEISFSPDETRVLYMASGSATLAEGVVKPFPGASTQRQERAIQDGKRYVYDIKEDRNFLVGAREEKISWLANSLNLLSVESTRVSILDYDGTNRQVVFSGNFSYPHAYPSTNANRILILTNLGAEAALPNLYWLSLK